MAQLRLQKRDDPLAINRDAPEPPAPVEQDPNAPAQQDQQTADPVRHRRPQAAGRSAHRRGPAPRSGAPAAERTYDEDRLEQTGWRMYESLLGEVRARAAELTAAGIPTSAAALAAATLHSHLPQTVEEGAELMRAYWRATAGRQRARRGGRAARAQAS